MKAGLLYGSMVSFLLAVPAVGQVNIATPANGSQVSTSFSLSATSTVCQSQPVASMGYSFDTGATEIIKAQAINVIAVGPTGWHTLHVKSWGNKGASCVTNLSLNIVAGLYLPDGVSVVSNIQRQSNWVSEHDEATSGNSTGSTSLVSTPSTSGLARKFSVGFQNSGGHRFHASFPPAAWATHFVYEAKIMLPATTGVTNIELDMNQVLDNGQTVIYGVQCDGWSNTWDYTINKGTVQNPDDGWVHSSIPCNPTQWAPNVWHTIQIAYMRDSTGKVTYQSVTMDGVYSEFKNAVYNSSFALGWGKTLLTNFQLGGRGTGSATAYIDNMNVYYW